MSCRPARARPRTQNAVEVSARSTRYDWLFGGPATIRFSDEKELDEEIEDTSTDDEELELLDDEGRELLDDEELKLELDELELELDMVFSFGMETATTSVS